MGWFRRIPTLAWVLLAGVLLFAGLVEVLRMANVPAKAILYGVQPVLAVLIASVTYIFTRQYRDRARHHWEKAALVACIVTVWFIFYFISGLFVTYVGNALASSPTGLIMNGLAFIVPGVALEYVRYKVMVMVGRRNVTNWGLVVVVVFSLYYINLTRLFMGGDIETVVHMLFAEIVPALTMSALLTYLAVAAGLSSMLIMRVGVLITTIVPPVIPKYDWYLVGLSSVLLFLFVYLGIDRFIQGRHRPDKRSSRQLDVYQNVILLGVFVGLMMLMSGFFAYKPVAIVSNSMKPVYSRGSMVLVQRVESPLDIEVGDIIQFEAKGVSITHRVIDIVESKSGGGPMFITQGDNSPSPDDPVAESQVTGIVHASAPLIGYPSVMLKEMMRQ